MIDLHVHTIYSDGEYTPSKILHKCKEKNITVVSITDHNSLEGCKQAILQNPYKDITVISGVEFGAIYPVRGGQLHILGYNIDLDNQALNDITKAIMQDNIKRVESLIFLLKKHYNILFVNEDIEEIFNSVGNIGRPEVAKLCVKYGYTKTVHEAFKKYFEPIHHKLAKRRAELTDKECIEYIRNAGGIACLAHPIELKQDIAQLRKYILTLISYGLEAVEVYQSKHTLDYSNELLNIVNEYGLLYSVGSDYHGPIVTPDTEIGYGKNNNLCMDNATILSRILEGNS